MIRKTTNSFEFGIVFIDVGVPHCYGSMHLRDRDVFSFICFDRFDDGVYIIFLHGTYPDGILDFGTEKFQQIPNLKRITWNNEAVERRDRERTGSLKLVSAIVSIVSSSTSPYLLWLLSLGKKPTGRWARGSHPSDKMEKALWMLPNPLEYRPWNSNEKRSYTIQIEHREIRFSFLTRFFLPFF